MNLRQRALTATGDASLTSLCDKPGMTMFPLPDAMSLLQAFAGLCLIALLARRRAANRSDWEGAVGKLSGRVRDDEAL
jgi:hypothetical protein